MLTRDYHRVTQVNKPLVNKTKIQRMLVIRSIEMLKVVKN